jgi:hypothetical protein
MVTRSNIVIPLWSVLSHSKSIPVWHCKLTRLFAKMLQYSTKANKNFFFCNPSLSLMRGATHAPLIYPSSSIYNKKIDFKQKGGQGGMRGGFLAFPLSHMQHGRLES